MKQIKKVQKYGVKFDSRLELFFFELLLKEKIPFAFQQTYSLHPSFKYNKSTVRAMTLTVDFDFTGHGIDFIVDTKGFQRNDNKLKWKLFKYKMYSEGKNPQIFLPKNQKECLETVSIIKNVCNLATKQPYNAKNQAKGYGGRVPSNQTAKRKTRGVTERVRRTRNTN